MRKAIPQLAHKNYAIITEYKLREAEVLKHLDPGGRIAGSCCGG